MNRTSPTRRWLFLSLSVWLAALAAADGQRTLSIMAVMHKQYTVSRAPFKIIRNEMGARPPGWDKVRAATATFLDLATTLAKNTPGEGSPESWQRLIDQHLADARVMVAAADASDLATLRAAHQRIAASCTACHDAHRFRRGN